MSCKIVSGHIKELIAFRTFWWCTLHTLQNYIHWLTGFYNDKRARLRSFSEEQFRFHGCIIKLMDAALISSSYICPVCCEKTDLIRAKCNKKPQNTCLILLVQLYFSTQKSFVYNSTKNNSRIYLQKKKK